jgi:hypothetical protein
VFATFLTHSMALLGAEKPEVAARLGALLCDREARVQVDAERLGIVFPAGVFHLVEDVAQPFIELRSSRRTILDVVDGRLTLEDAVWGEHLWLRGHLDDLVRFHDALVLYLQGAVRCPSFPWLLDRYRDQQIPTRAEMERRIARTSPGPPGRVDAQRHMQASVGVGRDRLRDSLAPDDDSRTRVARRTGS